MKGTMQDADIHQHIESLVAEEHRLLEQGESGSLKDEEHRRLADVNVQLDRYYDLLRQRRARRDAGQSPEDTGMRPAKIVEHYQQ